ncbi:MAG TPA: hypothetical protein DEV98_00310 [Clostridiales bacterium]|nr:hypothetical protein [Clostridiales bacterium]
MCTVRRGGACRIGHFFPPGRASNQENQGHKDRNRTDQILFFHVRVPFLLLLNSVFLFTLIDGFVSKKSTASGIFLKKFCLSLFTPAEKPDQQANRKSRDRNLFGPCPCFFEFLQSCRRYLLKSFSN